MVREGADGDRIRVCHTNVDTDAWRPDPAVRSAVRAELAIDEAVPVVLFAGRICEQKQPRVLAAALLELAARADDAVALVAGAGPDFEWLRSFVSEKGPARSVRLLGEVSNDRVRELMAAADIFFLPSKWEGISLALFEAMASGLAVVASDVGGQRELVTDGCGVLVPVGDEQAEATRYAAELAGLVASPARTAEMGRAARARVRDHFQLRQMGRRMVALLEEARELATKAPRQRPTVGLGRACAAEAIESLRLAEVTARLWAKRHGALAVEPSGAGAEPVGTSWGQRVYLALNMLFEPAFQWGVRRGWTWLFPLSERVKRFLLRG
jgi:hypothetical protein